MFKKINMILILLLLLVSITAVSASDDLNDTVSSDESIELSTSDNSDVVSEEVLTSNSHTVTPTTYKNYFENGVLISTSVNEGDTLNIDGVFSNKTFSFKKQVNVVGSSTNVLKNCIFMFYNGASGSTISNLNINNSEDYKCGVFLNGASNCVISGCTIKNNGMSSYAIGIGNNANHNNVTDNKLTTFGITYGHGTRSAPPLVISGSHYNYIANNKIICDDANGIYLSSYPGGYFNGGHSNFNIIYNNSIKYNVLPTSWSYGIQIMGSNNTINSNRVIGAYRGISTSGTGNIIINNKIINLTGADFNNPSVEIGGEYGIVAALYSTVINNTIKNAKIIPTGSGISALDYSIIKNNTVEVISQGTGIYPCGSYINIEDNFISTISGAGVLFNTHSFNLTVDNNTIYSHYGVCVLIQKMSVHKMPGNITIINNYVSTNNTYSIDARDADASEYYRIEDNSGPKGTGIVATPEGSYDPSKPQYKFNGTHYIINNSNYDEYISANGYLSATIKDGDTLHFEGTFSNKTIFINSAVKITGKNPIFHNVKFKIYSNGVWMENLTIRNDKVSNGWGVLVYRAVGATITNCSIDVYDKNAAYAIYVIESIYVDIIGNKLSSSGNYLTYTLLAYTAEDCRFINNTIFTNGTSEVYISGGGVCTSGNETCTSGGEIPGSGNGSCTSGNEVCTSGNTLNGTYVLAEVYRTYGILTAFSSNNIISGNNVTVTSKLNQTYNKTNSTNSLVGIDLYYNTHNNTVSNNNIYIYGYDNYIYGVGVLGSQTGAEAPIGQDASNNQFINNNIRLNGTYCVEGIIIGDKSKNTTIIGNIVNARADCVIYGINLEMSQGSTIKKNILTLNSQMVYGIDVYSSNYNIINNNTFEINAKQSYGSRIVKAQNNKLTSNIIFVNATGDEINFINFDPTGTGTAGVYLKLNSSYNNISENNITSKFGYAVIIDDIAIDNVIYSNYLDSENGIGNYAVNTTVNNTVDKNYKYLVTGTLSDIVIKYLEKGTFVFTTTDVGLEGANVTFSSMNGEIQQVVIKNGTATLNYTFIDYTPATYLIHANVFKENYKYTEFESTLEIRKGDLTVHVDNVTGAIARNAIFVATLVDILGNPVSGITVEFNVVDDGFYSYLGKVVSDVNGKAILTAEIPQIYSDNPKILVEIKNPDYFETVTANANLTAYRLISTSITINSKVYPGGILATLKDQNGSVMSNKKVIVMVAGTTYPLTTNSAGQISLPPISRGNYRVHVSYAGDDAYYGSKSTADVTVMPAITGNKNYAVYYGNTITYKLRIMDSKGKYVGAGHIVKVKVNGITYNLKTDKRGYVSKSLKLNAGSYKITAEYHGDKVSNELKIKPTLITKNIVTKKAKKIKFSVKLVNKNGKALKNKKITIKFKGKTYKVKTNKKGIVMLSLKKLKVGKYKIISKYGKCKISNTITIKR